MYAFIKHIKTSMEQLPAPTQVMGYNSLEEMKLSGHYNKLLDQFKEKVADPTLDTVFKLRKMLNKLSRDKQISRVSELEKRDYGIRSIQKNSRKLDKLVRSMNTYIDSAVNDDDYNNAIGVDIKLNRNNVRYQIRLRSDMDSRERINGIPITLEHRTTYDRSSDNNRGISKFVHLALPLYSFAITLKTPVMEVSDSTKRGENGEVSFKVPLPWDFLFAWTIELGKYMPKLLLEDFDELSEMKDYQDLLDYITEERRKELDGEESMVMLDDEDRESDLGLVRRSYGYGRSTYNGINFHRVSHWAKDATKPRYPHPFISSHDTRTPCWAGWRGDLEKARKDIDIKRLAFLLKGWATIYNESSTPHHNISNFMLGLPRVAKEQGFKGTQSGWDCWNQHGNNRLCDQIECTLTKTCEGYQTYLGRDPIVEEFKKTSEESLKSLEINGFKLRRLTKEEKEALLDGSETTIEGGNNG